MRKWQDAVDHARQDRELRMQKEANARCLRRRTRDKHHVYVMLVNTRGPKTYNEKTGHGRWYVCAKSPKDATEKLAAHIGNTHGSIRCYYECTETEAEAYGCGGLAYGQCRIGQYGAVFVDDND